MKKPSPRPPNNTTKTHHSKPPAKHQATPVKLPDLSGGVACCLGLRRETHPERTPWKGGVLRPKEVQHVWGLEFFPFWCFFFLGCFIVFLLFLGAVLCFLKCFWGLSYEGIIFCSIKSHRTGVWFGFGASGVEMPGLD